jgi:hypothetical protein
VSRDDVCLGGTQRVCSCVGIGLGIIELLRSHNGLSRQVGDGSQLIVCAGDIGREPIALRRGRVEGGACCLDSRFRLCA